ncbi:hypothetical protein MMPV_009267 [Pyropia vietnamensis]
MATPLRQSQLDTDPVDVTGPSIRRFTRGSGGSDSGGGGGFSGGHGSGVTVDDLMTSRGTIPAAGLSAFGVRGGANGVPPGAVRVMLVGGSLAAPDKGGLGAAAGVGSDVDHGLGPLSVLRSFDLLGGDGGPLHHAPVRTGGQAPRERVFHTLTRVPLGKDGVWHYLIGGRRPAHVYNSVYRLSTTDCKWEPVESQSNDLMGTSQRQKEESQLGQKWGHSTVLLPAVSTRSLKFKGQAGGSREASPVLLCFGGWTAASVPDSDDNALAVAPVAHVDLFSVKYRQWKRMATTVCGSTKAARDELSADIPRGYHTATALVDSRYMLVFGGVSGADGRPAARTLVLDTATWTWHAPEPSPSSALPPPARWRHCASHYPDELDDTPEGGSTAKVVEDVEPWAASSTAIIVGGYEAGATLTSTAYSVRVEALGAASPAGGRGGRGGGGTSKLPKGASPVSLRWSQLGDAGGGAVQRADAALVPLPEVGGWVLACGAAESGPSNALTLLQVTEPGGASLSPESPSPRAAAVVGGSGGRTKSSGARTRAGAKQSPGGRAPTSSVSSPPPRKGSITPGKTARAARAKAGVRTRGGTREHAAATPDELSPQAGTAALAAAAAVAAAAAATAAGVTSDVANVDAKADASDAEQAVPPSPEVRPVASSPLTRMRAANSAKRAAPPTPGASARKRRRIAEVPPKAPAITADKDTKAAGEGGDDVEAALIPARPAPPTVVHRPPKGPVKVAAHTTTPVATDGFGDADGGAVRPPPPPPRADSRTKAQLLVALDTAHAAVKEERAKAEAMTNTIEDLRAAKSAQAAAVAALKEENRRLRIATTQAEDRASSARAEALLSPAPAAARARAGRHAAAATSASAAAAAEAASTASALSGAQDQVRTLRATVEELGRQLEDITTERDEYDTAAREAVAATSDARKATATATALAEDLRAQLALAQAALAETVQRAELAEAAHEAQVQEKRRFIHESSTLRVQMDAEVVKRDRAQHERNAADAARAVAERQVERLRGSQAEDKVTIRELRDQLDASVRAVKAERTARAAAEELTAAADARAAAAEQRAQSIMAAALESSTRRAAASDEERRARNEADAALAEARTFRSAAEVAGVRLKAATRECKRLARLVTKLQDASRDRRDVIRRVVTTLSEAAAVGPHDEADVLIPDEPDAPPGDAVVGGPPPPPAVERALFGAAGGVKRGDDDASGDEDDDDDGDSDDSDGMDEEASMLAPVKVTQLSAMGAQARPSEASVVRLSQSGASLAERPEQLSAPFSKESLAQIQPPSGQSGLRSHGSSHDRRAAAVVDSAAAVLPDNGVAVATPVGDATAVREDGNPAASGVAGLGGVAAGAVRASDSNVLPAAGAFTSEDGVRGAVVSAGPVLGDIRTAADAGGDAAGAVGAADVDSSVSPDPVARGAHADVAAVAPGAAGVSRASAASVAATNHAASVSAAAAEAAGVSIGVVAGVTAEAAAPASAAVDLAVEEQPVAMEGIVIPGGALPLPRTDATTPAVDVVRSLVPKPTPTVPSLPEVDSAFSLGHLRPPGGSRPRSLSPLACGSDPPVASAGPCTGAVGGSVPTDGCTPAVAMPEASTPTSVPGTILPEVAVRPQSPVQKPDMPAVPSSGAPVAVVVFDSGDTPASAMVDRAAPEIGNPSKETAARTASPSGASVPASARALELPCSRPANGPVPLRMTPNVPAAVRSGSTPASAPPATLSNSSAETLTPPLDPSRMARSEPTPSGLLSSGGLVRSTGATTDRPMELLGDSQSFQTAFSRKSTLVTGESQSFKTALSPPTDGAPSAPRGVSDPDGTGGALVTGTSPLLPDSRPAAVLPVEAAGKGDAPTDGETTAVVKPRADCNMAVEGEAPAGAEAEADSKAIADASAGAEGEAVAGCQTSSPSAPRGVSDPDGTGGALVTGTSPLLPDSRPAAVLPVEAAGKGDAPTDGETTAVVKPRADCNMAVEGEAPAGAEAEADSKATADASAGAEGEAVAGCRLIAADAWRADPDGTGGALVTGTSPLLPDSRPAAVLPVEAAGKGDAPTDGETTAVVKPRADCNMAVEGEAPAGAEAEADSKATADASAGAEGEAVAGRQTPSVGEAATAGEASACATDTAAEDKVGEKTAMAVENDGPVEAKVAAGVSTSEVDGLETAAGEAASAGQTAFARLTVAEGEEALDGKATTEGQAVASGDGSTARNAAAAGNAVTVGDAAAAANACAVGDAAAVDNAVTGSPAAGDATAATKAAEAHMTAVPGDDGEVPSVAVPPCPTRFGDSHVPLAMDAALMTPQD